MDNETIIGNITTILGEATSGTISAYTHYFIWASVVWIVAGAILIAVSVYPKLYRQMEETFDKESVYVLRGIILVIGLIMFVGNLSDLVSPQAVAIHQLLNDITP